MKQQIKCGEKIVLDCASANILIYNQGEVPCKPFIMIAGDQNTRIPTDVHVLLEQLEFPPNILFDNFEAFKGVKSLAQNVKAQVERMVTSGFSQINMDLLLNSVSMD